MLFEISINAEMTQEAINELETSLPQAKITIKKKGILLVNHPPDRKINVANIRSSISKIPGHNRNDWLE